ncbi:MAG: ComEC family competence protein [Bacteroidales bacterium]|nr:ComEC family competence protein [Bacteroidales bacterium]
MRRFPFLWFFIFTALGNITSTYSQISFPKLAIVFAFILLILTQQISHRHSRWIPFFSFSVFFFFFILGSTVSSEYKWKAHQNINQKNGLLIGKIIAQPKISEYHTKAELEIIGLKTTDGYKEVSGKVLARWPIDSLTKTLKLGDIILFEPDLKQIDDDKNPEAFNYKRYLFFHLISAQVYLKPEQWQKIELPKAWYAIDIFDTWRSHLLQLYQKNHIEGRELAVLSALTLGYKNDLDAEIQKSYSASGAIHVLAVSGLHVGIIFIILSFFFNRLLKSPRIRWIKFFLIIIGIWFYALLTGASPSVMRASTMFSFIALGQALNKSSSIYNSIFASALLLIVINPFLLYDLSFQLSYSAVLSIVFFQAKIASILEPNNKLLKWIWGLTSVSLAAQFGTAPLTIFYFHQFPNYFLISNFIVIPIAFILIWLSVIFLVLQFVPLIGVFLAKIIHWVLWFQNWSIESLSSWPGALTEGLYIDKIQLLIAVLSLLLLMIWMEHKKAKFIILFLSSLIVFSGYSQWVNYLKNRQKSIFVYNIKGETAINLIDGSDNILISSLAKNANAKTFQLKPNWLALGLNEEKHISTQWFSPRFMFTNLINANHRNYFYKHELMQFYDKSILLVQDEKFVKDYYPKALPVNYIIVGNNAKIDLAELSLYFKFDQIIIDSSHSKRNLKYYRMQQQILPSKKIYIVADRGAFSQSLI